MSVYSDYNLQKSSTHDNELHSRRRKRVIDSSLADLKGYMDNQPQSFFQTSFAGNLTDQRMITIGGIDLAYLLNDFIKIDYNESTDVAKFYIDYNTFGIELGGDISSIEYLSKVRHYLDDYYGLSQSRGGSEYENVVYPPTFFHRNALSLVDDDTLWIDERLMSKYCKLNHETEKVTSNSFGLFAGWSKFILSLMNLNFYYGLKCVDDGVSDTILTPINDSFSLIGSDESSVRLCLRACEALYRKLTNNEVNVILPFMRNLHGNNRLISVGGNSYEANTTLNFKELLQITLPALRILINATNFSGDSTPVNVVLGELDQLRSDYMGPLVDWPYVSGDNFTFRDNFIYGTTGSESEILPSDTRIVTNKLIRVNPSTRYYLEVPGSYYIYEFNEFDSNGDFIFINTINKTRCYFTTGSGTNYARILIRRIDNDLCDVDDLDQDHTHFVIADQLRHGVKQVRISLDYEMKEASELTIASFHSSSDIIENDNFFSRDYTRVGGVDKEMVDITNYKEIIKLQKVLSYDMTTTEALSMGADDSDNPVCACIPHKFFPCMRLHNQATITVNRGNECCIELPQEVINDLPFFVDNVPAIYLTNEYNVAFLNIEEVNALISVIDDVMKVSRIEPLDHDSIFNASVYGVSYQEFPDNSIKSAILRSNTFVDFSTFFSGYHCEGLRPAQSISDNYIAYLSKLYSLTFDWLLKKNNLYSILTDGVQPDRGYSPTLLSYSLENLQEELAYRASLKLGLVDKLYDLQISDSNSLVKNYITDNKGGRFNDIYLYKSEILSTPPILDDPDNDRYLVITVSDRDYDWIFNDLQCSLSSNEGYVIPYLFDDRLDNSVKVKVQGSKLSYDLLLIDATNGKFYTRNDTWAQINEGTKIIFTQPSNSKVTISLYNNNFSVNGNSVTNPKFTSFNNSDNPEIITLEALGNSYIESIVIEEVKQSLGEIIWSTLCSDNDSGSAVDQLDSDCKTLINNVVSLQEGVLADQLSTIVEDYIGSLDEENLSIADVTSVINSVVHSMESRFDNEITSINDDRSYLKEMALKTKSRLASIGSRVTDSLISLKTTTGSFLNSAGSRVSSLAEKIGGAATSCGDLFSSFFGIDESERYDLGWVDSESYTDTSSLSLALGVSLDSSAILNLGKSLMSWVDKGVTWAYNSVCDFMEGTLVDGLSYSVSQSGFECIDSPAYQKKMTLGELEEYNCFVFDLINDKLSLEGDQPFTLVTQVKSVLVFYQYRYGTVYVSFAPIIYDYDITVDKSDFQLVEALISSRISVVTDYNNVVRLVNSLVPNLIQIYDFRVSNTVFPLLRIPSRDELYRNVFKGAVVSKVEQVTTVVSKYSAAAMAVSAVCLLIPGIRWFALGALAASAVVNAVSETVEKTITSNALPDVLNKAREDSSFANAQITSYELYSLNTGYDTRIFDFYNKIIERLGSNGYIHNGTGQLSVNGNYIPLCSFCSTPNFRFHIITDNERKRSTRFRLLTIAAVTLATTAACFKATKSLRLKSKHNKLLTDLHSSEMPNRSNYDSDEAYLTAKSKYKKDLSKKISKLSKIEYKLNRNVNGSSNLILSMLKSDDSETRTKLIKDSVVSSGLANASIITEELNKNNDSIRDKINDLDTQTSNSLESLKEDISNSIAGIENSIPQKINEKIDTVSINLNDNNEGMKANLLVVSNSLKDINSSMVKGNEDVLNAVVDLSTDTGTVEV